MATWTINGRVYNDGDLSDSGMPVAGHSQADCLMRELAAERAESSRLRQELGDLKTLLAAKDRVMEKLKCQVIDQRWTADALSDLVKRQNGTYDPEASEAQHEAAAADFDIMGSRISER